MRGKEEPDERPQLRILQELVCLSAVRTEFLRTTAAARQGKLLYTGCSTFCILSRAILCICATRLSFPITRQSVLLGLALHCCLDVLHCDADGWSGSGKDHTRDLSAEKELPFAGVGGHHDAAGGWVEVHSHNDLA
jgi:hypothetical protein